MRCAACERELEAFTGDVCPHCQHFAHPTRLGIYNELELIKRGGMGSVYRARHPELGTVVAIKTVHANTGPETLADRFEQEARLAARIPHPGVVRVFDFDCQEGRLYLVMEFVDGATLREAVDDASRDLAWKLDKMIQLAEVLQAAHEQGIIHRDIKPENVMVDTTGRVRVLDFGISRALENSERLTQTGEILGTPEYIAPEQILDVPEAVDPRTDIYAAGVVLYELLTGQSPFAGHNVFQVLKNVESLQPPPPSQLRHGIPRELDDLAIACLAKEPAERPADFRMFSRRLRAVGDDGTTHGAPRHRLAWIVAVILAGLSGFAISRVLPESELGSKGQRERTGVATIRALLAGPPPIDEFALASAVRMIPDDGSPEQIYWRGMAFKHTGSWFLARRDFERARIAGYPGATIEAALMWAYTRQLFPMIVPSGDVLRVAEEFYSEETSPGAHANFAKAVASIGRGELETASELLSSVDDNSEVEVLRMLCAAQDPSRHQEVLQRLDRARTQDSLAHQLLRAIVTGSAGVQRLQDTIESLDRMAPMRYLLEAAVAASQSDIARRNAALELAQVAGEAEFAVALFATTELHRYDTLRRIERETLSQMIERIEGAPGAALTAALEEKKGGK